MPKKAPPKRRKQASSRDPSQPEPQNLEVFAERSRGFSESDSRKYGTPTGKAPAGMISPGEPVPEETLEAIADELVEDPGDSESENLTDEDKFPPEELLDGKQRSRPNRALMVARYVSACSSRNSTTESLSAAA
jgi:hypothetical protein